jgi:DNA-directed RNA polymerase specialized sigma24 family protein
MPSSSPWTTSANLSGRTEYTADHVRALIEDYQAYRERVDTDRAGLNFLVQLLDLDRALAQLSSRQMREVVLVRGLAGKTISETCDLLNCGHSTVERRYPAALEEIVQAINQI